MRGSSKIPGHSQLYQLNHHLPSDPDLRSAVQGDVPTSLVEKVVYASKLKAGPVQHWPALEIDLIHSHLGGHLPSARLVKRSRGLGTSPLLTLVDLAW